LNLEKYTNTMKGKDAKNNKRILKILAEKNETMNVTELTRNMLPKKTSRYSKKFASRLAVIYRRTKALAEMKYLDKYKKNKFWLSLKGRLLASIIFPEIEITMPIIVKYNVDEDLKKLFIAHFPMKQVVSNTFFEINLIRPFEKLLSSGQINLDVISNEELFQLINEKMRKIVFTVDEWMLKKDWTQEDINAWKMWFEKEILRLEVQLVMMKKALKKLETLV